MAKCNGSTPNPMNVGPNTGPSINIAGPASKNIPTKNSNKLTKNSKTKGFWLIEFIISIAFGAVPVKDTNVAKAVEAPTKNKIIPDDNAALNKTLGISLNFNVRRTKTLINIAYPAAIAAASVGVKIPASIPPKIIIGVKSGSIAPLNEIKTSLNEAL